MQFTDPQNTIEQFNILPGSRIADLGAGSGVYAMAAAHAVGPEGRVYAIEVQKDLLERIKNMAKAQNLHNVEIIRGDIEKLGGTKLRDYSLDAVIISNVLFQIEDMPNFLNEVRRILKMRGRVLAIDWSESFGNMGPPQEKVITEAKARELFEQKSFTVEREMNTGDHHWGLVLRKEN